MRLDTEGPRDYHFMRYLKGIDAWAHKPGTSAVLRYDKDIENNAWKYETFDGKWNNGSPYYEYTGTVRYILYK